MLQPELAKLHAGLSWKTLASRLLLRAGCGQGWTQQQAWSRCANIAYVICAICTLPANRSVPAAQRLGSLPLSPGKDTHASYLPFVVRRT